MKFNLINEYRCYIDIVFDDMVGISTIGDFSSIEEDILYFTLFMSSASVENRMLKLDLENLATHVSLLL